MQNIAEHNGKTFNKNSLYWCKINYFYYLHKSGWMVNNTFVKNRNVFPVAAQTE